MFAKYYPPEAREPQLSLDIIAGRLPQAPVRPAVASSTTQLSLVMHHPLQRCPCKAGRHCAQEHALGARCKCCTAVVTLMEHDDKLRGC